MAFFNRLLLAIDINSEAAQLLERVRQTYGDELDRLHVVHVIKYGLHDAAEHLGNPHLQRLTDHTLLELRALLYKHGLRIPADRVHLAFGEPASEIKRMATELAADLVIVGSHTRTDGWLPLPGATTNCVIQGIDSDVVAMKA
ncbi:MAG: universal stress protein [Pseudohongiellaceae bacterium]